MVEDSRITVDEPPLIISFSSIISITIGIYIPNRFDLSIRIDCMYDVH